MRRWEPGEVVVRREISCGRPVIGWPVRVVLDAPELLALYTPTGAPFSFSDAPYPSPTGRHAWWPAKPWVGHGVLMLQRPGDAYAVWHFWSEPDRAFRCWYLNLQDPFRRTPIGIDSDDHELDIVIDPDGTWKFKDLEVLDARVEEGRYSNDQMTQIRSQGAVLARMIDSGTTWWDHSWAEWCPPTSWETPGPIQEDWESVPW